MIPFDGIFAQNYALPFATAAYVATNPPEGFIVGTTAFEIVADTSQLEFQVQLARASDKHKQMMQSMLDQRTEPQLVASRDANQAKLLTTARSTAPNRHFGWICVDDANKTLVVAFRGTEFFHDWLDNFDFIPAPYAPIPGRGTVHQGFQLVYSSIRNSVRTIVAAQAPNCTKLFLTGHSLGGALVALAAPDLLNDAAANLSPTVYTFAEPRVGHSDYTSFFDTHVNVCYRIVNIWDVVSHLPPVLAGYRHEGNDLSIDSGFSLDIVRNHVLSTGYVPGLAEWNRNHPVTATRHFGNVAFAAVAGKSD
jgi:triacylglycerol lipase